MVDSRQKGARGELAARDILRKLTNFKWERVPASGALSASHGLKGDLYIPNENNRYCVEVKNYAEDHITSKLLSSTCPEVLKWWEQAKSQANKVDKIPLLLIKHTRSKWFAIFNDPEPSTNIRWFCYNPERIYICMLEDLIKTTKIEWVK